MKKHTQHMVDQKLKTKGSPQWLGQKKEWQTKEQLKKLQGEDHTIDDIYSSTPKISSKFQIIQKNC